MTVRHTRRMVRDFQIHTLANDAISFSMAPALGGRIVSMRDRVARREWLDGWAPASKRRIWHPTDPADYETGPGAGLDECLPTVLPCEVGGVSLPDHGELWNQAPEFEIGPQDGYFCRWSLRSLPLAFERRVSLAGDEIRFDYRLENLADTSTPFLWAWHPLFTWKRGDQIRFAPSEKTCISPGGREVLPWPETHPGYDLSRADFPNHATPAAKVFLGPLADGVAEIRSQTGASLSLRWPSDQFSYAGIWITRGFWKGLHHWAIEPTNAPVDRLSDLWQGAPPSRLPPREVCLWTIVVRLHDGTVDHGFSAAAPASE